MKQATWLPVFTGYYESIFDGADMAIDGECNLDESEYKEHYEELYKAGVTQEYFNENFWDYANFTECYNEASSSICDGLLKLDHSDIIINIEYEKTVSPKEYNFTTDAIYCVIEYDVTKLKKYLLGNLLAFTAYIDGKYTSCDGFSSHYSNDIDDWLDEDSWRDHQVGSLLEFVISNNDDDAVTSLYNESYCYEDFYNYEFDTQGCIDGFKKQLTKKEV